MSINRRRWGVQLGLMRGRMPHVACFEGGYKVVYVSLEIEYYNQSRLPLLHFLIEYTIIQDGLLCLLIPGESQPCATAIE